MRQSNGEECDMTLKNNIEGIIIKWAYQIEEVKHQGLDEIRCPFHQHFIHSFYKQRSRKRKNDSQVVNLCLAFGIYGMSVKAARKMLMKLPIGVNFINILSSTFLCKSVFAAFLKLQFGFVIFWLKNTGAACKILMKSTIGVVSLFC